MIGNDHIQLVMSLIRIINDKKGQSGKKFISKEGLRKIESKFIKIANFINRIENGIYNNNFSNWMKEIFNKGFDYPLYMFSDEEGVYVSKLKNGRLTNGAIYTDVSLTNDIKYAMDFRELGYFIKKLRLNKVNKILELNQQTFKVRYKAIVTIEKPKTLDIDLIS